MDPSHDRVVDLFPQLRAGRWEAIGGARMHVVDTKPAEGAAAGGGETLLAVHGNPTWSFYWRGLFQRFANSCRVVAADHIGCGLSDKPGGYSYHLRQHAENLAELVERLDLNRVTLVVHDWGGPIGLLAALGMPQRIRRLVITNTGLFPPPYVPWRIRACRIPGFGTLLVRGGNLFARAAVRMATEQRGGLSSDVRQGMLWPYRRWSDRVAVQRFVQDIPLTRRHRSWSALDEIERRAGELADRPVLMVWGMRDWCFRPNCLTRIQAMFPAARTVTLPDAGHYLMEDAAERVLDAIERFLADTSG